MKRNEVICLVCARLWRSLDNVAWDWGSGLPWERVGLRVLDRTRHQFERALEDSNEI